ncbi:hypothetical protein H8356DRAFT_1346061 [Neocallimastix lanati (nom. inval.)]|nr:hypothetical protein H8356DRAFT_1346061 [Neocallimastix sp. JGI-2020a]
MAKCPTPTIIDLNYKKEWDVLFKNQIITGDYSKTLFVKLCLELVLVKGYYSCKLTRRVNAENEVRQASMSNAFEGEDHNFFQIVNSNPNP